jgi:hypothetical protein
MVGPLPGIEHLFVAEETGELGADHGRMRRIIAREHQTGHAQSAHEIARDAEDEVPIPHIATEACQRRRIEISARRALFFAPGLVAVRKVGRGVRIEPDRILQHRGADPFGCHLTKLEAEARSDTTPERVEAPVAQMIH